eukprot:UN03037
MKALESRDTFRRVSRITNLLKFILHPRHMASLSACVQAWRVALVARHVVSRLSVCVQAWPVALVARHAQNRRKKSTIS